MSKPGSAPPYALFEGNTGGFLIMEFAKGRIALPYIALRQITHSQEPERIVMEFTEQTIEVQGKKLEKLFEFLASLRVRTVRVGVEEKGPCSVEQLVLAEG
jgi:hypothetical protein